MKKRRAPEHDFQTALLAYLDECARPELYWFAIANGELRHVNVGKRLKAEGVKPGVPDIEIMMEEGKSAYLELKAPKGRLSDAQLGFRARAIRLGHLYACVNDMPGAVIVLMSWRVLRPGTRPLLTGGESQVFV